LAPGRRSMRRRRLVFLSWRAAFRTSSLDWNDYSRWVGLGLLLLGLATWAYGDHVGIATMPASAATSVNASAGDEEEAEVDEEEASLPTTSSAHADGETLPLLPAWASIPFDQQVFGASWPFGLVAAGGACRRRTEKADCPAHAGQSLELQPSLSKGVRSLATIAIWRLQSCLHRFGDQDAVEQ
jgi:hypothetical protein